mgnify:CR=1 FL=1
MCCPAGARSERTSSAPATSSAEWSRIIALVVADVAELVRKLRDEAYIEDRLAKAADQG